MIKLNGWKRVGIIASFVWIIGAYCHYSSISGPSELISSIQVSCDADLLGKTGDAYTNGYNECNKQADDSLAEAITAANQAGEVAALVPVPFGWGFVYLVLFLVRWVRRGFIQ